MPEALADVADLALSGFSAPVAFVLKLPLMVVLAFTCLWCLSRGGCRLLAVALPPLGRIAAHAAWYILAWPEAAVTRVAIARSGSPFGICYVYSDHVDALAIAIAKLFVLTTYLARWTSKVANPPLVLMGVMWAVLALLPR